MKYDPDFVYDLEVRVMDLESKVERLEDAIRKAMSCSPALPPPVAMQ